MNVVDMVVISIKFDLEKNKLEQDINKNILKTILI